MHSGLPCLCRMLPYHGLTKLPYVMHCVMQRIIRIFKADLRSV